MLKSCASPSQILQKVCLLPGSKWQLPFSQNNERLLFVLSGVGHLQLATSDREEVCDLNPNLGIAIPAGFEAKISVNSESLEFLCFHLDHTFQQEAQLGVDNVDPTLSQTEKIDLLFKKLDKKRDHDAPDGTMCYPIIARYQGDLNLFVQPAGCKSTPVLHPILREAWYVLAGEGEMQLKSEDGSAENIDLRPGVHFDILPNTAFHFSNSGSDDLRFLIVTQPCWDTIPEDQRCQLVQAITSSSASGFFDNSWRLTAPKPLSHCCVIA